MPLQIRAFQTRFGRTLASKNITGGAVYDALVAASAAQRSLPILTADRRAARTYEALDVEVVLVDDD